MLGNAALCVLYLLLVSGLVVFAGHRAHRRPRPAPARPAPLRPLPRPVPPGPDLVARSEGALAQRVARELASIEAPLCPFCGAEDGAHQPGCAVTDEAVHLRPAVRWPPPGCRACEHETVRRPVRQEIARQRARWLPEGWL